VCLRLAFPLHLLLQPSHPTLTSIFVCLLVGLWVAFDFQSTQVFQVRKKDTGQVYAMKVLKKKKLVDEGGALLCFV
jgi:hypothetical protein